jgi:hypothetical protein
MLCVTITIVKSRFNSKIKSSMREVATGDAKALLLAAGQPQGAAMESVLGFIPQRSRPQALLHGRIQVRALLHAL